MEEQITLEPWAKINLYLKVLGRRNDGYHDLVTLIHPIALFDRLIIRRIRNGFVLNCRLEGLPPNQNIPYQQDNLVAKAVRLFFKKIGQPPSVEIELVKRIPIGGGLGGGSSDSASTLIGLNQLFGYPLTSEILYNICLELGMDVPFFMEPRPALCTGRGEVVERRYDSIKFWCVLVNPGKCLSTQSVYNNLILTDNKVIDNISRFAEINPVRKGGLENWYKMVAATFRLRLPLREYKRTTRYGGCPEPAATKNMVFGQPGKGIDEIVEYVYNDLEKPAIRLYPEVGHIIELVKKAGAIKSFVCGSGSTVCGLAKNKEDAEEVIRRVSARGSRDWWIRAVSSLPR